VRSLLYLDRPIDALAVLDATRVLPSEHSRESHQMYVQAHTLAALSAYNSGRWEEAAAHLNAALEWPERLGQGKPYDPEERLIRFLQGRVAQRRDRDAEARSHFEAVVAATGPSRDNPFDVLATVARQLLNQVPVIVTISPAPRSSGDLDAILLARALALSVR
jgi:hypothetical protein